MNRLAMTLVAGALSIGAYVASPAAAAPPSNGCATENRTSEAEQGLLSFAVADLAALGYRVPGLIDDPANGGNGDGFVCGVPSGNQTTPDGRQLYLFFDNQLGPV
jgi:hypothetical protein